jgi:dTDP-4-dehydrorhamnose reductase
MPPANSGPSGTRVETILLTGASGSLGGAIASHLLSIGRTLVGQHHRHAPGTARMPAAAVDLADRGALRKLLDALGPGAIVHTAAASDVDWCEDHPQEAERVNVGATEELARWSAAHGAQFIHVSTDLVFDGEAPPYDEDALTHPLSHYARTKVTAEGVVREAGGRVLILRVALLYGRGSRHKGTFLDSLLGRLEKGEQVALFTDQFRTPVFLGDVARVVERALDLRAEGLYHVGGPERLSRLAFGSEVCRVFGYALEQLLPGSSRDMAWRGARPADVSLVSARVARDLEWSPLPLREALEQVKRERIAAG